MYIYVCIYIYIYSRPVFMEHLCSPWPSPSRLDSPFFRSDCTYPYSDCRLRLSLLRYPYCTYPY